MELSSLNELLDRIAALRVASDYDQIGLKPDPREIDSPQVTHHVAVVGEQCGESSPILRTKYVRIPNPSKPDTRGGEDVTQPLNLKLGSRLDSLDSIQEPKLPNSETPWPLSLRSGKVPDLTPPANPNIRDLSQVRQEPTETVHHYWARFLLVMNRIEDCRQEDAISSFCNNCTDIGILNAISRRDITCFTDLASMVRKYYVMESIRKTEIKFWDDPALNTTPVRNKRVHYRHAQGLITKTQKPSIWYGTVLEGWLNGPCKIHSTKGATLTHSLRACWILRQVARSGEELLTPESAEHHPRNTSTVSTVFETFASNSVRK